MPGNCLGDVGRRKTTLKMGLFKVSKCSGEAQVHGLAMGHGDLGAPRSSPWSQPTNTAM